MKFACTLLLINLSIQLTAQNDLRSFYNAGMEAYKAQDFEQFLYQFQRADSLSPDHPTITYNLAAAYAKNGLVEDALKYVKKFYLMNTAFQPEDDEDFSSIKELNAFGPLLEFKENLLTKVEGSQIAFTNPEIDLHPESVAFDPKSKDFFLNSVRKGKVVRYNSKTKTYSDFATGLWSVMGMKVFGNSLWICTVATTEHENFSEENEGKTALVELDLKSGKVLNRYELSGGHWFGDLVISKSGTIYLSDSRAPIIYTLGENQLEIFKDFTGELFNLQGLAFNQDESALYIADYKIGIHRIEMESKELSKLPFPDTMITKGVDGLYFYNNSLIAVHNGVKPFRVAQYGLDKSGTKIIAHKYLDKARPELNEPTLGVLINDTFYYVANSPWGAYKEGQFDSTGLGENLILKYELK